MYAIYAWMRAADDLADEIAPGSDRAAQLARIEAFRTQTHTALATGQAPTDASISALPYAPMWPAVVDTLRRYAVNVEHLDDMIAGQLLDGHKTTYANWAELHDYCYKVASTVGLVCIGVWGSVPGSDPARVRELAIKRGVALQLTNILRDVVEDETRDRVYLPGDEVAAVFGTVERFRERVRSGGGADSVFIEFMRPQIARARRHYDESAELESHLASDCRSTSWAIMRIYRGLLDKIEADPGRVLRERVRLSTPRKLAIGLGALWRR
jgi:15-cis-phytoene synthase